MSDETLIQEIMETIGTPGPDGNVLHKPNDVTIDALLNCVALIAVSGRYRLDNRADVDSFAAALGRELAEAIVAMRAEVLVRKPPHGHA